MDNNSEKPKKTFFSKRVLIITIFVSIVIGIAILAWLIFFNHQSVKTEDIDFRDYHAAITENSVAETNYKNLMSRLDALQEKYKGTNMSYRIDSLNIVTESEISSYRRNIEWLKQDSMLFSNGSIQSSDFKQSVTEKGDKLYAINLHFNQIEILINQIEK